MRQPKGRRARGGKTRVAGCVTEVGRAALPARGIAWPQAALAVGERVGGCCSSAMHRRAQSVGAGSGRFKWMSSGSCTSRCAQKESERTVSESSTTASPTDSAAAAAAGESAAGEPNGEPSLARRWRYERRTSLGCGVSREKSWAERKLSDSTIRHGAARPHAPPSCACGRGVGGRSASRLAPAPAPLMAGLPGSRGGGSSFAGDSRSPKATSLWRVGVGGGEFGSMFSLSSPSSGSGTSSSSSDVSSMRQPSDGIWMRRDPRSGEVATAVVAAPLGAGSAGAASSSAAGGGDGGRAHGVSQPLTCSWSARHAAALSSVRCSDAATVGETEAARTRSTKRRRTCSAEQQRAPSGVSAWCMRGSSSAPPTSASR
mmetsp:Transcript_31766/g.86918  ORF Transcript_31766/g.86918 Transcript_31766/m.86918 type:complete len:373 (-) Transcript_31766:935-2053(-)